MEHMQIYNNILETIGNTPLVRINRLINSDFAAIYAKLEFLNPGGSIKDRMALYIIEKAEREGKLKPGSTIIENTSGNTGAGLAIVASVKGYKVIFTIPDKMSAEKINYLKAFGAEVIVTPTDVPADSPESYYETAKRLALETPDSFYVNQYHNLDNPEAHYEITGREIWDQTNGDFDYLVAGIGTGGTLSGVGRFLKERKPQIKIIAVDPEGSVFYDYFKSGKPGESHVYKLEGIGEDMMVGAMDFSIVDDMLQVSDQDAFNMARDMARKEGFFAGGSSGAAMWGALEVAKTLDRSKKIVTILPDTGFRYLSKFFQDEWMAEQGFMD
jgi:cystathionine beta-synthase